MFDVIVITAANEAQAAGYREQVSWRQLRADLESNPPNPYARVFSFNIDPVGLKVTVL